MNIYEVKKKRFNLISYFFQFFARCLAHINPKLLTYSDSIDFTIDLIEITQNAKKEIIIFEGTLGLIQLSSLGEHITKCLILRGYINIIQNNLLESNEYIIHSNLELLNNIFSFDEIFNKNVFDVNFIYYCCNLYLQNKYSNLFTIVFALFNKYIEDLGKNLNFESNYIETTTILNTLFGIFAMGSHLKNIKVKI